MQGFISIENMSFSQNCDIKTIKYCKKFIFSVKFTFKNSNMFKIEHSLLIPLMLPFQLCIGFLHKSQVN